MDRARAPGVWLSQRRTFHVARALDHDGRRLHHGQPRARLHPRHPDRAGPRHRARSRCLLRLAALPKSVPQPVRRGRLQCSLRAAVRQAARERRKGERQALCRGGDGSALGRAAAGDGTRRSRHALAHVRARRRLCRQSAEVRAERRAHADHVPLSLLHRPDGPSGWRAQLAPPICACGGSTHPAQRGDDHRARRVRAPARISGACAGRRHDHRRHWAVPVDGDRLPPGRNAARLRHAPDHARHPQAVRSHAARHHRVRRDADQSRDRHPDRLLAGQRGLLSLLRGPHLSATARRDRLGDGRGVAARAVAPSARGACGGRAGRHQSWHRVHAAARAAGGSSACRAGMAHHHRAVRARGLHGRGLARNSAGSCHLCLRTAGLRAGEAADGHLLCP